MATVAASRVVHARAPGRITLFVKVGPFGPEDECEVATAYQTVSLYGDVRVIESDSFTVSVGETAGAATGSVSAIDGGVIRMQAGIPATGRPADRSKLALKAARLLARAAGRADGAHLEILGHPRAAGGWGGEAAAAAATLLACDELWQTGRSKDELMALARKLGPEVAFAFSGGTAVGSNQDRELSPALAKGQFHWVLALPDFVLDAAAVFRALDEHRNVHVLDISPATGRPTVGRDVLQAIRAGDCQMLAECLHNDLQAAALRLSPRLTAVLEAGEANGALAGVMTGSGPGIAFLAEDADASLVLHRALADLGHDVVRVVGPVHGARLVEP